jgi:hypothetical protein
MRVGIAELERWVGPAVARGWSDAVSSNAQRTRVVREDGLWLEVSGDRLIRPQIVWDPEEAGKVDLVLVPEILHPQCDRHSRANPFRRRCCLHAPKRHRES